MAQKPARNGSTGKRESILRAATRVFARNGYFNSKVADVARVAGVADGTVYLYFKSKEEILRSIFEHNTTEAVAAGREELAKIKDPREKLRRIARHHLERLGDDRDLAVVFQVELRGTTKFMEEFSAAGLAEYLGLIREVFEEGQRAGVFRKELKAKRAAILSESSPEWVIADVGCQLAGIVNVPLYPTLAPQQVSYILEDSGARLIFVQHSEAFARIRDDARESEALHRVVFMTGEAEE